MPTFLLIASLDLDSSLVSWADGRMGGSSHVSYSACLMGVCHSCRAGNREDAFGAVQRPPVVGRPATGSRGGACLARAGQEWAAGGFADGLIPRLGKAEEVQVEHIRFNPPRVLKALVFPTP